jgi:hypothetical protein
LRAEPERESHEKSGALDVADPAQRGAHPDGDCMHAPQKRKHSRRYLGLPAPALQHRQPAAATRPYKTAHETPLTKAHETPHNPDENPHSFPSLSLFLSLAAAKNFFFETSRTAEQKHDERDELPFIHI